MPTPKRPAAKKPKLNQLDQLKALLKDEIRFLEEQKRLPYTLRGQADAIESQLSVLRKYMK